MDQRNKLVQKSKFVGHKMKWQLQGGELGGTLQQYCKSSDTLTIVYSAEPGVTYDEDLIANGDIKLIWAALSVLYIQYNQL